MQIPKGLTQKEEWEWVRKAQGRETKQALVEWLMGLATWKTKADLTFESLAHPERAEKAVNRWLKRVAKGSTAVVGYERQERGAIHAHLLVDRRFDYEKAKVLWNKKAGFCRIEAINTPQQAMEYAVKHTVKGMNMDIIRPGSRPCPSSSRVPTPYQVLRQLDAERSLATREALNG